jgi:hypothetical protein
MLVRWLRGEPATRPPVALHRHFARIDALELLVDLQNPAQFLIQRLSRDVRQIQIHRQSVLLDAQSFPGADVKDLARGDVARHEIAIFRIALFQEIVALALGNILGRARILRALGHPHAAAFTAGALAHQPQLVGAGYGRRMDLNEFGVGIFRAGLKGAAGGAAGAGHRHRRAAVDQSASARGDHHRVGRKGADLHRHHVLGHDAAAHASAVDHRGQVVQGLVDFHFALDAPAAHLIVQRIEQLLAGRGAGKRGALE